MMKKRVRLEEAFEFVKQRRSIISPNFSFMGQLLQFESQVLGFRASRSGDTGVPAVSLTSGSAWKGRCKSWQATRVAV
uniref:protein-tyrosine-phosphatase n=1 Tax=Anser cygnoides TaxID=8845 RepID=A0A8B9EP89_ANSCY